MWAKSKIKMSDVLAGIRYLTRGAAVAEEVRTDVLVLGGGVAGLRAALAAAQSHDVLVLAKDTLRQSASAVAQGGIAAAIGESDDPSDHAADTLRVGCGLSHRAVVEYVVRAASFAIDELLSWGANFDTAMGTLALGREGGHSAARIAHAMGDATGWEIVRTLKERVRASPRIRLIERAFAIDLIELAGRIAGCVCQFENGGIGMISARATILATGGAGCVFRETTNPAVATGDGMAMAFRAGAVLRDMEMVQFHPTALYIAGADRALISEAVRGEGARLVTQAGRRFMFDYDARGELAARDTVSRAIIREMRREQHPCVYLDARHFEAGKFAERFPGITRALREFGIDAQRDLIPVRPAAHYFVGGVVADMTTRTSLPGLLACGEVASSGLHGANRLASNSLLEGLVFGRKAGLTAAEVSAEAAQSEDSQRSAIERSGEPQPATDDTWRASVSDPLDLRNSIRSLMDRQVGIERTAESLRAALEQLLFWMKYAFHALQPGPPAWETQNMLTIAWSVACGALRREESRGVHFRADFQDSSDAWRVHNDLVRAADTSASGGVRWSMGAVS
ncbi:MAG: L-aspartate oxidase [Phycisphaerales bacterium]|nr:L-aspartate oxidase [Phycisphaerales bacterium]